MEITKFYEQQYKFMHVDFSEILLREIPGKIDMLRESIHSFVFNIYLFSNFN